ncbi:MAG TPA: aminoacyl-tRNA hydrolase [Dehalococcoidia bacterium]|nr:aminoacyl-tRNA hydrolase [Dehalococcoidia bacterium]
MKIIVGLGNPGRGYANNRHNIGFICLNHFARAQGIRFDKKQDKARISTGEVADNKVVLVRSQTYMNLSGESISRLIKRFDINLNDLLVIHDDLDLPLGKIRIRQGGSSGGHKGIESIVACLGRQDFVRLRVGIGRPTATEDSSEISDADIIAYVLTGFTPDQKQIITTVIPRVSEAIYCLLSEGLTAAMNKYN